MKKIMVFFVLGVLELLSSSALATTWFVTVNDGSGTPSYHLWGQTSPSAEYPVIYKGIGTWGTGSSMGYQIIDPITIWNDHGAITVKYTNCTWTGEMNPSGKAAAGNVFCSGRPPMGWEANVYQN